MEYSFHNPSVPTVSYFDESSEFGVKILNTFYDIDSGMMFCLVDAPDRYAVEKHDYKFGTKYEWITQVKLTAEYDVSEPASE